MPFYEYECASCKFYSEVMQKITDAPLKKCPSCGKNTLQKLISAPVFRLKGGGWYETDFKSDKESKRNLAGDSEGSDSKSGAAAAPADAKAGDSKPADTKTKTETKPAAAEKPSSGESGTASRSASKATARPAPKAPKRKSAPKPKAKAGKRRGR